MDADDPIEDGTAAGTSNAGAADAGDDDGSGYTWQRAAPLPPDDEDDDVGNAGDDGEEGEEDVWGVDDLPEFADDATKEIHARVRAKEAKIEEKYCRVIRYTLWPVA